jgi:hypothetical protein
MRYLNRYNKFCESWLSDNEKKASGIMKELFTTTMTLSKKIESKLIDWTNDLNIEEIRNEFSDFYNELFDNIYSIVEKSTDNDDIEEGLFNNIRMSLIDIDKEYTNKLKGYIAESKLNEMNQSEFGGISQIISGIIKVAIDVLNETEEGYKEALSKTDNFTDKKSQSIKEFKSIENKISDNLKSLNIKDLSDKGKTKLAGGENDEYKVDQVVRYKRDSWDNTVAESEQPENIAQGQIKEINGDTLSILNLKNKKTYNKKVSDILGNININGRVIVDQLRNKLASIKDEPNKMADVLKLVSNIDSQEVQRLLKELK